MSSNSLVTESRSVRSIAAPLVCAGQVRESALVKVHWIDYELPRARSMFLVAATRVLLFRFCVIEVPQTLLAGD